MTSNALYYFGEYDLQHKLILIEDMDGAEALLYALRELISKSIMTIEKIVGYFKQRCDKENIADEMEISHNDIMAYIKSCTAKSVTQKTAANYLSHIKKYYDYLIKEQGIHDNPCSYINIKGIKRKVVYDIIPFEALENLYRLYWTDTRNKKQSRGVFCHCLLPLRLRSAALHFAQGLQAKRGNKVGGRSCSTRNHASPMLSWQEMDLLFFIVLPSKRSPSGCFIALRRLSCFL
ncbi:MAG: site-specific integrase [Acidobacterium ailaaui]|nr:site-specific integrase [Pseudacidobacterium ailaaui]